jgi:hypothetical protein
MDVIFVDHGTRTRPIFFSLFSLFFVLLRVLRDFVVRFGFLSTAQFALSGYCRGLSLTIMYRELAQFGTGLA